MNTRIISKTYKDSSGDDLKLLEMSCLYLEPSNCICNQIDLKILEMEIGVLLEWTPLNKTKCLEFQCYLYGKRYDSKRVECYSWKEYSSEHVECHWCKEGYNLNRDEWYLWWIRTFHFEKGQCFYPAPQDEQMFDQIDPQWDIDGVWS